jgi:RNA polymerase sigma factor (sigma-70 family)
VGHSEAMNSEFLNHESEAILQLEAHQAIEVLMDKYGDEIKRLIYTYVKNSADTDDVIQEVFVTIYRKLNTFQGKSSLRSWIYSIAINKSKDYLRSWQSRNKRLKEKLTTSQHDYIHDSNVETPEELTMKQDESSNLLKLLLMLPVKYREVLILFYFKDFSTKEIGTTLGMKETTVRTRLNRGREQLRRLLSTEERGGYDG